MKSSHFFTEGIIGKKDGVINYMNSKTNRTVLTSLELPVIQSKDDLVETLHLSASLIHLVTRNNSMYKYRIFTIAKKHGGVRKIYAPSYSLKIIQRWVLENILYKIRPSDCCFGYIKGMSKPLTQNADKHKNNLFILKLDLENFFTSLKSETVFGLFESIGYNEEVAAALTNICTCDSYLPQGAVTSPYLSNLLCSGLDLRLYKYCAKRDITYTRYVDDLTFSGNNRDELKNIYHMLQVIIENEGLKINKGKTHFMTPKTKKCITGVTISNGKLKAPHEMKRLIRSMIHRAIVSGDYSESDIIRGYVAYVCSIEEDYRNRILKYIDKFYNDPINLCEDAVRLFNKNKLFNSLKDLKVRPYSDFANLDYFDEYESYIHERRQEYLTKCGYALNTDFEE